MMKIKKTVKANSSAPHGGLIKANMDAQRAGRSTDRPSPSTVDICRGESVPSSNFDSWSALRLEDKTPCTLESSMSCIPMRGDPICAACHEGNVRGEHE